MQKFDNHVDKLMNYLRFWQTSGESEKTSIRISSKMQQMQTEGLYTGGAVKFGHRLVDSGLVNRKGIPIQKYEIDPMEKEIMYIMEQCGRKNEEKRHIAMRTQGQALLSELLKDVKTVTIFPKYAASAG
ncbi:MAG: hypothetical protein K2K63_15990 [Acetatifactor sp.]|nr:hypothetical protein [Acetatifactor sp.]